MEKKISNIKERILYIADFYQISKEKFFLELEITYGNFKGKAKERPVNSSFLEKLLTKFPDVDPDWLLLRCGKQVPGGEGKNVPCGNNALLPFVLPCFSAIRLRYRIG